MITFLQYIGGDGVLSIGHFSFCIRRSIDTSSYMRVDEKRIVNLNSWYVTSNRTFLYEQKE